MKKSLIVLIVIVSLIVPTTTCLAAPRIVNIYHSLSFSGTTAKCSVTVTADATDDEIVAVVKLWQGSSCIATWSGTGEGYLFLNKSKTVTSGKSYKMTVDITINGVARPTKTDTGTCP